MMLKTGSGSFLSAKMSPTNASTRRASPAPATNARSFDDRLSSRVSNQLIQTLANLGGEAAGSEER